MLAARAQGRPTFLRNSSAVALASLGQVGGFAEESGVLGLRAGC